MPADGSTRGVESVGQGYTDGEHGVAPSPCVCARNCEGPGSSALPGRSLWPPGMKALERVA